MHRCATDCCPSRPGALFARFLSLWATCLLALTLWIGSLPARAETPAPELSQFAVSRNEEGLLLDFAVRFDLPHSVEDALLKGVPLHFVADASLFRERWYWRDQRVNRVTRTWRLAYQPLTRTYRVSFGGLNQSFDSLADAVASVRRMGRWKLTEQKRASSTTSSSATSSTPPCCRARCRSASVGSPTGPCSSKRPSASPRPSADRMSRTGSPLARSRRAGPRTAPRGGHR